MFKGIKTNIFNKYRRMPIQPLYSYFMHPNKNCMSYYNHFRLSIYYSRRMFVASIKAIIHAFFPQFIYYKHKQYH